MEASSRVVFRWLRRGLIGGIVAIVALLGLSVAAIEIISTRLEARTRIETENGIESLESVRIGGVDQTIYLRGQDRSRPILLFVHGGPGSPETGAAREFGLRLEEHFVVVHWDQRGAGNSCSSEVPDESLHLEQYVADTLELVHLLRERFGQERIFLLGHSWGSVLGVLATQRHPELFHAYVGLGQVVNMRRNEEISYRFVVDRARAEGNERALEELSAIQPPYDRIEDLMLQRTWLGHYGGAVRDGDPFVAIARSLIVSPEYSLSAKLAFYGCTINSLRHAWDDLDSIDFLSDVRRLDVPVYFLTGRYDYNTPFELVEEWMEHLEAPHAEIIWFEESAHMANLEQPEAFQDALIQDVLGDVLAGRARGTPAPAHAPHDRSAEGHRERETIRTGS